MKFKVGIESPKNLSVQVCWKNCLKGELTCWCQIQALILHRHKLEGLRCRYTFLEQTLKMETDQTAIKQQTVCDHQRLVVVWSNFAAVQSFKIRGGL